MQNVRRWTSLHDLVRMLNTNRKWLFPLLTGLIVLITLLGISVGILTMPNERNNYVWKDTLKYIDPKVSYYHFSLRDVEKYTSQLISGVDPDVLPINRYDFPYTILNARKCFDSNNFTYNISLLLIVKSATKHFDRREAIRQTWGWEQRFPDVVIQCIFNLGSPFKDTAIQHKIEKEQQKHGDIIQGNFTDSYHNNTIKTMLGFRWVVENCPSAKFVMFVDDDMYVSVKNVLQFANRPEDYPKYLQTNKSDVVTLKGNHNSFTFDLNEPPTFAGHAKYNDPPFRVTNKWYISPSAYPFSIYPPYVPAGSYLLSFQTLRKMYYTSMYTPHYMYDDVYLGMCAKRAGIVPFNNDYFKFEDLKPTDYKYVISVHGFGNTTELMMVWTKQYKLHYA